MILAAGGLLIGLSSGGAIAQPPPLPGPPRHSLSLTLRVFSSEYEEPFTMDQKGTLGGAALAYGCSLPLRGPALRSLVLRMEGELDWGDVDYDGRLIGGTPYRIDGIPKRVAEVRATAGVVHCATERVTVEPFVGVGYRYLTDDASFDATGYARETRYYYLPVGVRLTRLLPGCWRIVATGEYDLFLHGRQDSHLSDVDGSYPDLENRQSAGSGARGRLALGLRLSGFTLAAGPFIRYWSIDESSGARPLGPYSRAVEPRNRTVEAGLMLAVGIGWGPS